MGTDFLGFLGGIGSGITGAISAQQSSFDLAQHQAAERLRAQVAADRGVPITETYFAELLANSRSMGLWSAVSDEKTWIGGTDAVRLDGMSYIAPKPGPTLNADWIPQPLDPTDDATFADWLATSCEMTFDEYCEAGGLMSAWAA